MSLRRPVAAFLLATTPACMATSRVAPAPYLATNHPAQMVVLDDQGSMHLLGDPAMVGDTLVGIEIGTEDTLSLPVSQVQQAVVQAKSPLKTAMLIGGLTALTGLAVVGIVVAGSGNPCATGSSFKDQTQGTGTQPCTVTPTPTN